MRKFLISMLCIFACFSAYCADENIPTSKSYVDSALVPKQDIIEGTTGNPKVLTNTGTAGEYETKDIYDSTNAYSGQMDALIDAQTMNAAVQNAIDSEFQCAEYNPNDPTDCWLMEILGVPSQSILPTGYTALEYIESTGTQYINSDIPANSNVGVSIKYSFMQKAASKHIFGSFTPHYYLGIISNGLDMSLSYGPTGGNVVLSIPTSEVELGEIFTLNVNLFSSGTAEFVGIKKVNLAPKTFTTSNKIGLFALGTGAYRSTARIYNMKITEGNNLVRNFIPARRDNDGVLGMYDLVSNTLFTNNGTGEFVAGPIIYLPSGD